jgi:hypothetical protein
VLQKNGDSGICPNVAEPEKTVLQNRPIHSRTTVADAVIAILLPTLKRFSCNGAMNSELSSKFTLSDYKTVSGFVKLFHSKSTLCSSPQLHCN